MHRPAGEPAHARAAPAIAAVLALAVAFWWPAIRHGRTVLQGDAIVHGLPLVEAQAAWVAGRGSAAWAPWAYGGHPLFAEGQGAFACPLDLVFALAVTPATGPVAAMNLFHAAAMALAGIGTAALCVALGLGATGTLVAAVGLAFCPLWAGHQQNLTIGGALAFVPWTLWAVERWRVRPDPPRSAVLGAAICLQVLAGYPQLLHATAIYAAVSLLADPAGLRRGPPRRLAGQAALAIAIAIGLSAVQWLPLAELVGRSGRAGGTGLVAALRSDPVRIARAAAFARPMRTDPLGGLGSLLLLSLAVLGARAGGRSGRGTGHLAATLVLAALGLGDASPAFGWIYAWHLVPGEHFFRITAIYLLPACLGACLLAGMAVDAARPSARACLLVAVAAVAAGLALRRGAEAPAFQIALCLAGLLAIAAAPIRAAGPVLAALVLIETVSLRLHALAFLDPALLRPPRAAVLVAADPAAGDDTVDGGRTFDATLYGVIGLAIPDGAPYARVFRDAMGSFVGMTDRLWDLDSMNGALALSLARRQAIEPILRDEALGRSPTPPGRRLIDRLSVRAIAVASPPPSTGLVPLPGLGPGAPPVFLDPAALPRLRLAPRHLSVPGLDAAIAATPRAAPDTLVLEDPRGLAPADPPSPGPAGSLREERARDTLIRVRVQTAAPTWLFFADADYPGWSARIDGRRADLFAADVLGKAVRVPAGTHVVEFRFRSRSIEIGLAISVATALAMVPLLARPRTRARV